MQTELKNYTYNSDEIIKLLQGTWVHEKDSLMTISVVNFTWIFKYAGEPNTPIDTFQISIVNKLPEFVKKSVQAEFLILTNQSDSMSYEILGLNEELLSLMSFPMGKNALYIHQKK